MTISKSSGLRGRDLVALAIMALFLLAGLLVFLPSRREQARRDVCIRNLQQIAQATADYATTSGRLPTASSYGPAVDTGDISTQPFAARTGDFSGESCFVQITPYIEETIVQRERPGTSLFPEDVTAEEIVLASIDMPRFRCPTFSGGRESGGDYKNLPYNVAAGNYVAFLGPYATQSGTAIGTPFGVINSAPFKVGPRGRKLGEISQTTILFTESRESTHNAWVDAAATWVLPFRVDQPAWQTYRDTGVPERALNFGPGHPDANSKYLTNRHWGPSSEHGQVVIHVFADTHTLEITDDIDDSVYAAYFAGNEPPEATVEE